MSCDCINVQYVAAGAWRLFWPQAFKSLKTPQVKILPLADLHAADLPCLLI